MLENNPYFWWNGLELPVQVLYLFRQYNEHEIEINELKEKIKAIDNLDETIEKEVTKIIDEMYQNGKLDDLLARISYDYLSKIAPQNTSIDLCRVARTFEFSNNDGTTDPNLQLETYTFSQGGCYFVREGIRYWLQCCRPSGGRNGTVPRTKVRVRLLNISNPTWTTVRSKVFEFGHANSACYSYSDDCFYISETSVDYMEDGTIKSTPSKKIYKLSFDFENMEFKTVPSDQTPNSNSVYGVSNASGNNQLYIGAGVGLVYLYDFAQNRVIERISNATIPLTTNVARSEYAITQDMSVTDDYIYFLYYKPNNIVRYNRKLGAVDWVYTIPNIVHNGTFNVCEVENITAFNDGQIYIGSSGGVTTESRYRNADINQLFVQNVLKNNMLPQPMYYSDNLKVSYGPRTLGIWAGTTGGAGYIDYCPDGSKAHPFSCLSEAIWTISSWSKSNAFTFVINLGAGQNHTAYINGLNVRIACSTPSTTIGNLFIENSNVSIEGKDGKNISIRNVTNATLNPGITGAQLDGVIYCNNGKLSISGINFVAPLVAPGQDQKAVKISNGVLICGGTSSISTTSQYSGANFVDTSFSVAFTKGIAGITNNSIIN